jgi:hypothetical protein
MTTSSRPRPSTACRTARRTLSGRRTSHTTAVAAPGSGRNAAAVYAGDSSEGGMTSSFTVAGK